MKNVSSGHSTAEGEDGKPRIALILQLRDAAAAKLVALTSPLEAATARSEAFMHNAGGKVAIASPMTLYPTPAGATAPRSRLLLAALLVAGTCFTLGLALCVARTANAQSPDPGGNDLITAASAGDLPRVRALLAAKVAVNAKRDDGATALIVASGHGHKDIVQALLDTNADVNAKTPNGFTALSEASAMGYFDVVQLLKNAGAKE